MTRSSRKEEIERLSAEVAGARVAKNAAEEMATAAAQQAPEAFDLAQFLKSRRRKNHLSEDFEITLVTRRKHA